MRNFREVSVSGHSDRNTCVAALVSGLVLLLRGRAVLLALAVGSPFAVRAEEPPPPPDAEAGQEQPWSLDLTVHDFGIGIGNSKRVNGLRFNFRDVAPFT